MGGIRESGSLYRSGVAGTIVLTTEALAAE
jgi:hypothetical protein